MVKVCSEMVLELLSKCPRALMPKLQIEVQSVYTDHDSRDPLDSLLNVPYLAVIVNR